jgi:segregation and condensation protein B
MSEGCKRTLAIIAYKEPVSQSEIIKIQGNKAYTYLKRLQKMNLIKAEKNGRTKTLKLTQEFERYFGEEKEKIKEKLSSVHA